MINLCQNISSVSRLKHVTRRVNCRVHKKMLMLPDTFLAYFVVFHHEICDFIIFISFFLKYEIFATEY